MNSYDLCQWLRDNSSGDYRPAREAADLIEELSDALDSALNTIRARDEDYDMRSSYKKGTELLNRIWKIKS